MEEITPKAETPYIEDGNGMQRVCLSGPDVAFHYFHRDAEYPSVSTHISNADQTKCEVASYDESTAHRPFTVLRFAPEGRGLTTSVFLSKQQYGALRQAILLAAAAGF